MKKTSHQKLWLRMGRKAVRTLKALDPLSAACVVFLAMGIFLVRVPRSHVVLPVETQIAPTPRPQRVASARVRYHAAVAPESLIEDKAAASLDGDDEGSELVMHRTLMNLHVPTSMALNHLAHLRPYTYMFGGKVTLHGKPVPNASVLARLMTAERTYMQGAIADEKGEYTITIQLQAAPDEAVDFAMEAHDPDGNKAEMVGRRISAQEDDTITVQKPLDMAVVAATSTQ